MEMKPIKKTQKDYHGNNANVNLFISLIWVWFDEILLIVSTSPVMVKHLYQPMICE